MMISQAMRRIARLKGQMSKLCARAKSVVSYDKAKPPAFKFDPTREEIAKVRAELVTLKAARAKANAMTSITCEGMPEMTLAEAVCRLQEYKDEMSWLEGLTLRAGTDTTVDMVYDQVNERRVPSRVETVYVTELTEVDRAAAVEALQAQFDALNDAVETANRTTQLDYAEPKAA